jgi:hypothetical protein
MPELRDAALHFAAHGLHVFPLRPRDKVPVAGTHGVKDATADRDQVEHWWRCNPDYNIGLATGAASKLWVLDADGLEAEAQLRRLEAQHDKLPDTIASITARGRHLFWSWPHDRSIRNSAGKLAPGLDVRGAGGYIVAPPSVHPTGRRYEWSVDNPKGPKALAAAPAWLLEAIGEPREGKVAAPAADWVTMIRDGVDEPGRNVAITRLVGRLLRSHVDPDLVLELAAAVNDARCRPPLSSTDVSRVVNSITDREWKRRTGQ